MARASVDVKLISPNVVLKDETRATLRQLAKAAFEIKSERLLELLAKEGFVANGKVIKVIITNAEKTGNLEIL